MANNKATGVLRAVIIDDEEKGRKLLRNLLSSYCPEVDVVDMADSVEGGLKAIRNHRPNLIFLDIVMPNSNGFQLLEKLDDLDCEIIFTTAYDQYAIRAIKVAALDYLLKPIDVEELQLAVSRAVEKCGGDAGERASRLHTLLENYRAPERKPLKIGVPTHNGIRFIPINKIFVCKAEGNYTTIFIEGDQREELVSKTLKEFEELLIDHNFLRTHRSYLVNLNHLTEYQRVSSVATSDGEGGRVIIGNRMKIPVSRDKRKMLLERISSPF